MAQAQPLPLVRPGLRVLALDVQYEGDAAFVAGALFTLGDVGPPSRGGEPGRFVAGALGRQPVETAYRPGLFCFREGPPLSALVAAARADGLEVDALVVDGHGLAHPRRLGVACWLGLACGLPTVGCAKQALLRIRVDAPLTRGGAAAIDVDGERLGYAVRRRSHVKPVFASPGHLCSPEEACDLVRRLPGAFRIPDPLRAADRAARRAARGQPPKPGWRDLGELPAGPAPEVAVSG